MKIFLFVNSFPNYNAKRRCVFNFRFVKQLQELNESFCLVFFRTWLPGRKLRNTYNYEGIIVTEAFLPLIPHSNYYIQRMNTYICKKIGWKLFKKELKSCDLIHSVYLTTNGIIANDWAKKLNIPHISQAIGSDVNSDLVKLIRHKDSNSIKNIDAIITNSKHLEKKLHNLVDNCPRTKTIYRGIAVNKLEAKVDEKKEGATFLYLGGLEANKTLIFGMNTKGGLTLMNSWKLVEETLFSMEAMLLFGGPNSDSKVFKKWKNSLKHPELIKLIGQINPEKVKIFLQKSNISIVPSMEEGLPNFLLESAVSKTASIGSDAGGIPEVIVNGKTGFIFKKGNVTQLSELLLKCASSKEGNKKMGEAAFERISTSFDAKEYSQNVLNYYKKIIDSKEYYTCVE